MSSAHAQDILTSDEEMPMQQDDAASSSSVEVTDEPSTSGSSEFQTASENEDLEELCSKEDTREKRGFMQHGCSHYRRRCKLVSPCCGEVTWCRHCHNTAKHDNEQDPKKQHQLDRKAVKELVCAMCSTRQPVGKTCIECGCSFGAYSCLACNFFDDDTSKKQFHCDKCGICRVGGRENYFHCDTCNCCYSIGLRDTHVCIENSMHNNCPVCFEYLFDSVKAINVMPCGHTIHQECLRNLAEHRTYVCPCCSKSFLSQSHAAQLWQSMDEAVASTPMPEEYKDFKVGILCNDCSSRCNVQFHVVGHKCTSCGGYNTRRI